MFNSQIFAHRGASGSHFENTMSAFRAAVKQGADGIEIDVQQTIDGTLVVIHDDQLGRVAGVEQQINEISTAELQHIKVGKTGSRKIFGQPVPNLFDVITFCLDNELSLNIELKETVYGQPAVVEKILHYIESLSDVHISSFDYPTLQLVKEQNPRMETALLLKKNSINWADLDSYEVDALHFHKRLWKDPYQDYLKSSGKKLRMYGVTGTETFLDSSPEVSGWITDYPKRVRKKIKGSR